MALEELVARALDDLDRRLDVVDPYRVADVLGRGQAVADDLALDPVAQAAPHRPDEDQRPVAQQAHLEELPDHHRLERGADAAVDHHVGVGQADELVEAREEGGVGGHLVEERVRLLLHRQQDGEAERARLVAVGAVASSLVRRPHEPRPAAGDDVAAHVGEPPRQLLHLAVVLLLDGAAGAEDRHPEVALLGRRRAVEPGRAAVERQEHPVDEAQHLAAALAAEALPLRLATRHGGSGQERA